MRSMSLMHQVSSSMVLDAMGLQLHAPRSPNTNDYIMLAPIFFLCVVGVRLDLGQGYDVRWDNSPNGRLDGRLDGRRD